MRLLLSLLCLLCLLSCEEDNKCEGDPFFQNLFIEIIDSDGNNLISNNTFKPSEIIITDSNGYSMINPVQNIPNRGDLIVMVVYGNQGNNSFEIKLSDTITDTLVMNVSNEITEGPCSVNISTLNSVAYNGVNKALNNFEGFLITVVK